MANTGGGSYSPSFIRRLLENYAALEAGQFSSDDFVGLRGTKRSGKSPFEMGILLKCDIDQAIQGLPPILKFVVLAVDIDGRTPGACAYWLDKTKSDVLDMEDAAIRRMAGALNSRNWGGNRPGAGRKSS